VAAPFEFGAPCFILTLSTVDAWLAALIGAGPFALAGGRRTQAAGPDDLSEGGRGIGEHERQVGETVRGKRTPGLIEADIARTRGAGRHGRPDGGGQGPG